MIKKEAVKILKHKDLTNEIHCVRNVKAKVTQVTTAATGTISKSLLSNELRNYRKQPFCALHIYTAESAGVEVPNIFHGRNNITCSTDCKYRTATTLSTLETWIVSGI